ncbi:conserved Plasmodium protein, unknown function [Plasmodium berghei]|uniref:Uncharacterized protein n=1 Tax=Plasmodium berghei TaxID=5821 RepID=A0A0Z0B417_PLABE|nr:conserved Plasmodium protein, unknown function [Plasmodium berghei]SCO62876.1 conserved Plasmodium protein, unknown function [Plasmodium berghei]
MNIVNEKVLNSNTSHLGKIGKHSDLEYLKKSEIDQENINVNNLDNLIPYSSVSMNTKMGSNMNTESVMQSNLSASTTSSGSEKSIPNTFISMGLNDAQNYCNGICMNENNLPNNKYDNSICKDRYINKEMENKCLSNMNNVPSENIINNNNEYESRIIESDKESVNPCINGNDVLKKSRIINCDNIRINELGLENSKNLNQIYGKEQTEEEIKYDINLNSEILNGEIVDSEILNKQMVASEILKNNMIRYKISKNQFIDDTPDNIISQISDENKYMNPEISIFSNGQNIKLLKNNVQNDIPINIASSNEHVLLNSHLNNTNVFNSDTITNCNGVMEKVGEITNASGNEHVEKEIGCINVDLNKIQDIKKKDDIINNLDNKYSQKIENRNKNNEEKFARQKNNSEMKKSDKIYNSCSKIKKNENIKELNLLNKNKDCTKYSSIDNPGCCSKYPKCTCYSINNSCKTSKIQKKNRNNIMGSNIDAICSNKTNRNDSTNNTRDKEKKEKRRKKEQINKTQGSIEGSQANIKKEIDIRTFRCNTSISNQNYINNLKISTINDHNNYEQDESKSIYNLNELTNEDKELLTQYIHKYGPISVNNNYELLMRDKSLAKSAMNTLYKSTIPDKKNTSRTPYQGNSRGIMNSISQNRENVKLEHSNFDKQNCIIDRNTDIYPNFIYEQLSKPISMPNIDEPKQNNINKTAGFKERSNINNNEIMYNAEMNSGYCQNKSNAGNILPYDPKMNIKNKYYKKRNQRDIECMINDNFEDFSGYRNEIYNNPYDDCNGIAPIMNNNRFVNNSKSFGIQDIMNINNKIGNIINGDDDDILHNTNLDRNKIWTNVAGNKGMTNVMENNSSNVKNMFKYSMGSNKMRDYDISGKSMQANNSYISTETNDDRQLEEINNFLMNKENNLHKKEMHMSFNQNHNISNLYNEIDANYDTENLGNTKTQNKNTKNNNRKGGKIKKSKSFGGTIKKGGTVFNLDLESYRIKKTPLCIYSVSDICNNYKLSKKHIKYTASYEVAVDCDCTIHHSIQCVKDYVGFLKEVHLKKKKKNEQNKYGFKAKSNNKGRKQNKNLENGNECNKNAEKNDTQFSEVSKTNIKVEENKMGSKEKMFIKKEKLSESENEKENEKVNIKVNIKENIKKERMNDVKNKVKKENNKNNEIKKRDKEDEEYEDEEYEDEDEEDDDEDEEDDEEDEDGEDNIYNLSQCNNILYNINKIWHPGFNRPLGDVGRKLILKEIREHHHRDPKKTTDLLLERGLDYGKVRFMRVNELYHYMYALDSFEYAIKISLEFGSNIRMSTISNKVDHSSLCLNLKSGYSYCLICCSQRPDIYGLYSNINLMQHMLLLQSSYKYLNKFARKTNLPKKDKLARAMRRTMEKNRNDLDKIKEVLKENEEICNKYPEEDIEERHRYYMIQKNWNYVKKKKNRINKNDSQSPIGYFNDNNFSDVKKDGTNDYIIENDKIYSYNNLNVNIICEDNTNESPTYEVINKYEGKYSLNGNNIYNSDTSIKNNKQIYYESEIDDKTSKNKDKLQEECRNVDQNNIHDHNNDSKNEED